jgi:TRAP-type mannitol/chloroaromatic compound transport system permease small subunit
LLWGSWAHFERAFDWSAPLFSRDSTIDIGLPIWPAKILVPIGFTVLCLRLTIQLVGYGKAFTMGITEPVAVPLVQDAAKQAAAEAETVINRDL